jgi:hypothetical protein
MPLYYFHLVGDHPTEDDEGTLLTDDVAALRYARQIARDLGRNRKVVERHHVRVVNDKGAPVGLVTLAESLSRH